MTEWVIDDHVLRELIRDMPEMIDKAIRATALDVQGDSQNLVRSQDIIDTGAMLNSAFTETSKGSTFEDARRGAAEMNPDAVIENGTPKNPPALTAYVSYGVNYAIWQELGHHGSAGRPFLGPAVEMANGHFEDRIREFVPQ